ncbi:MAG: aldo/keto reductase [Proteobacteria bacterium]|nr:aldo/keto reductase [Pseudomonadota bacterium]MBU4258125.1 aldo/keto reductase [Pseudomonadota bacterium]MBU4286795.1 aldo/keto reductase [Pseudomonadota bacterium]MBU4413633.1 aldo/keto reductase [Pseudomonadota bacterium]MCG2758605.1 aldo/keto reductase [Desulfobacteraceae bacterium]
MLPRLDVFGSLPLALKLNHLKLNHLKLNHLKLNTMFFPHLVLGTAQLGLPYGLANKVGQPDQAVAITIIREAWKNGIREFDTAQAYGDSEKVLGKALYELGISSEAKIITKFHPNLDHLNASDMSRALDESLERLRVRSLYGIMLHREEMLSLWNKGLAKILHAFILSGRVEKIGISVYSPDKAIQALNTEGISMVQLPTNIVDRRFENTGVFKLSDEKKKQIYIRSVFLQGLLLMNPEEISDKMSFVRPIIKEIQTISNNIGLSQQEIALGYVKSEMPNAHVVFGAESSEQVKSNIACWRKNIQQNLVDMIKRKFDDIDEVILNPNLWPK